MAGGYSTVAEGLEAASGQLADRDSQIVLSQAISLKRLADTLDYFRAKLDEQLAKDAKGD